MKLFNEQQMELLKPHEEQLFRALHQKYYRSTNTKTLDALKAIYDSVADTPYNANWSCGHCVLSFLAALGKIYFDTKDSLAKAINKATEETKALADAINKAAKEIKTTPKKSTAKTNNSKTIKTNKK